MDKIIIDCSKISRQFNSVKSEELAKFSSEFGDALSTIGFAYLINHGVNLDTVNNVNKLCKQFFELPCEVKRKYARAANPGENNHGYGGPTDEVPQARKSVDMKEFYSIWGADAQKDECFPFEVPGLKDEIDKLRVDCNHVIKKLFISLGKYLHLENEQFFIEKHECIEDTTIQSHVQMRSTYYSVLEDAKVLENTIRMGEHTDYTTITLLFQDMIGGLEVKLPNGEWVPATPIKDSIVVISGRLLDLWSAGIFPATPHRVRNVVNRERNARQSYAYFVFPDGDTHVKPIVPIGKGQEKYEGKQVLNAYEYYRKRLEESSAYNR